jgi:hypothetical protein
MDEPPRGVKPKTFRRPTMAGMAEAGHDSGSSSMRPNPSTESPERALHESALTGPDSTQTLFWAVAIPVTATVGSISLLTAYGGPLYRCLVTRLGETNFPSAILLVEKATPPR